MKQSKQKAKYLLANILLRKHVTMLEKFSGLPISDSLKSLTRTMALDAYDTPHYNTPAIKDKTIRDFTDKYTLLCEKTRN